MIRLNLFDTSFAHTQATNGIDCAGLAAPAQIKWIRNQGEWDGITVFTESILYAANLPLIKQVKSKYKIAWILEPPEIRDAFDFVVQNRDVFDYVCSSYEPPPALASKHLITPFGGYWVSDNVDIDTKKFCCSYIMSGKGKGMHGGPAGYSMRWECLKMIEERADTFAIPVVPCGGAFKHLETKDSALESYMFSVVIENSKHNHYFTEKINDCFRKKVVPIYWGSPYISNYYDERGIITFSTPEELFSILQSLTTQDYFDKIKSIEANHTLVQDSVPENYLFNSLGRVGLI
tara:strand:- start:751 stop:1623 length:873 start_codon:yes stop_codon:yes gene_type:complete